MFKKAFWLSLIMFISTMYKYSGINLSSTCHSFSLLAPEIEILSSKIFTSKRLKAIEAFFSYQVGMAMLSSKRRS